MTLAPPLERLGHHGVERQLRRALLVGGEGDVGRLVAEREAVQCIGLHLGHARLEGRAQARCGVGGSLRALAGSVALLTGGEQRRAVEGPDDAGPLLVQRGDLLQFARRQSAGGLERHDVDAVGHIREEAPAAGRLLVAVVEPDDGPLMLALLPGAQLGHVTGVELGVRLPETGSLTAIFSFSVHSLHETPESAPASSAAPQIMCLIVRFMT